MRQTVSISIKNQKKWANFCIDSCKSLVYRWTIVQYYCKYKIYSLFSGMAKLSFELEVCRIPNLNVVGIRRKRLKGDAWCYKKVCEEVLRLAAVSSKWTFHSSSIFSCFTFKWLLGAAVHAGTFSSNFVYLTVFISKSK